MLFSTFYLQSLLILGMQPIVMGEPIPKVTHEMQTSGKVATSIFIRGVPEYRSVEAKAAGALRARENCPRLSAKKNKKNRKGSHHRAAKAHSKVHVPLSADAKEALRRHNAARAKKGVAPLVWSDVLTKHAKAWAKQLAENGIFEHSPDESRPDEGENLAYDMSSEGIPDPLTQGTQQWLNEAKDYHNQIIPDGIFADYGHYTQIMWNTTTEVGIATVQGEDGGYYTVARYSPAGNIDGLRPY
ncbi:CAP domain-containing protein [Mariannaea sp. PMI_226]|nr:CAP domain-containing protein [Mariannaea sp. PMI_226]